ncbi:hypothetical protein IQ07DRAFT_592160 [Pyrenochaeta sp. DS3sAY3a]|nr:hypothetical protein IQ07DRAFT_592160 [Pyrenochaeta sp. DS3sAY3a]
MHPALNNSLEASRNDLRKLLDGRVPTHSRFPPGPTSFSARAHVARVKLHHAKDLHSHTFLSTSVREDVHPTLNFCLDAAQELCPSPHIRAGCTPSPTLFPQNGSVLTVLHSTHVIRCNLFLALLYSSSSSSNPEPNPFKRPITRAPVPEQLPNPPQCEARPTSQVDTIPASDKQPPAESPKSDRSPCPSTSTRIVP